MRRLGKVLGVALVGLVLFAVPVKAAEVGNRPFLPEGTLDGKNTPAKGFDDPCGLGLDPFGQIYVADYFHHAIDLFSGGLYQAQRTKVDPLNGPCGLAVDSTGTLYVNDFHEDVRRLSAGEFVSGPGTVIDAADSTGVAVDPATNRVYVDDRTYVAVYEPSGAPVIEGGEPLRLGAGQLQDAYGLAVSGFAATKGDIYLADAATKTVKVFGPAGALIDQIDGAGSPQGGFVSLADAALAVDPTNGHLLVVDNTQPGFEAPAAVVDEFNAAGAYRGQLPHAITDGGPSGLAVDGSGGAYVTSGNGEGASVLAFGAAAPGHTLSVGKEGAGGGTVSSEPAGINCGSACVAEYDAGAVVVLTATPDGSSTFGGWSGCASVSGEECVVTLGADRAVSASFDPAPASPLSAPAAALAPAPSLADAAGTSPPPASKPHRHHHKPHPHKPRRKGS
jgi:DNA-binding beta-propeller fold protein YncE